MVWPLTVLRVNREPRVYWETKGRDLVDSSMQNKIRTSEENELEKGEKTMPNCLL